MFGNLKIYPRELRIADERRCKMVTPKTLRLLMMFYVVPHHILTREDIARKLWVIDKCPSSSSIDVCVKRLRNVLKEFSVTIVTRHAVGYELIDKS